MQDINFEALQTATGITNRHELERLWRKFSMTTYRVFYVDCNEKNIKDFTDWSKNESNKS